MFGFIDDEKIPEDPARMNEIVLAYVGDCVYELYVRNASVGTGEPRVNKLNRMSSLKSRASYQAEAIKKIEPDLDKTEAGVVRRARNKKITSKPRNAEPMDYKSATAFEALVGYLYLTGNNERMEHIIGLAFEESEKEEERKDEK